MDSDVMLKKDHK